MAKYPLLSAVKHLTKQVKSTLDSSSTVQYGEFSDTTWNWELDKKRDVDTIDIMLKCMHILIGVSTVNKIFWCNNNWLIMNYIRCTCWGAGWKCARHCKNLFATLRSNFAKSPWEHFITKKYVWHCKQHLFFCVIENPFCQKSLRTFYQMQK